MAPFVSEAQRRYFEVNRKKLESQGVNVSEWEHASKGLKLPKHVKKHKSIKEHFNLITGRKKIKYKKLGKRTKKTTKARTL